MFVDAIAAMQEYTRPLHTVVRHFKTNQINAHAATLFFVNDKGDAITCGHVVDQLLQEDQLAIKNDEYRKQKSEIIKSGERVKLRIEELNKKMGFFSGVPFEIHNRFMNCCTGKGLRINCFKHKRYDLGLVRFSNYDSVHYSGYATLLKDSAKVRPGTELCRIGYPFAEFSNYSIDPTDDMVQWTTEGNDSTPFFPLDGIITRLVSENGEVMAIEMSTPGLIGQSGGPLFDSEGVVYGMQFQTQHLPLGFDIEGEISGPDGKSKHFSNHPFLHVGRCIHIDVIKKFLMDHGVEHTLSN